MRASVVSAVIAACLQDVRDRQDRPISLLRRPRDTFRHHLTGPLAKSVTAAALVCALTGGAAAQWDTITTHFDGFMQTVAGQVVGTPEPTDEAAAKKDLDAAKTAAAEQVKRSEKLTGEAAGKVAAEKIGTVTSWVLKCKKLAGTAERAAELLGCVNSLADATDELKAQLDAAIAEAEQKQKEADEAARLAEEKRKAEEAANQPSNPAPNPAPQPEPAPQPQPNPGGGGGGGGGGGSSAATGTMSYECEGSATVTFRITGSGGITGTLTGPSGATGTGTFSGSGTVTKAVSGGSGVYKVSYTGVDAQVVANAVGNCW
ncbi:hypothetical protein ACFVAJ_16400 [Agromyces sp. NPDC057679]|uniref:hypothetical protein n=1 Tax=Agromyces sp. NPDC057679 TaxID=3346207 RepID=UPI00366EA84C